VIIDDAGPLAFLFLNNNLHAVHHMHPRVAWYDLPQLYRQNAQSYDGFTEGYNYASYAQIFKTYFVKAKDPVPHPLWPFK
jgi:fatty acid desaturase